MMSRAAPYVKWAGGKRQILPALLQRIPAQMKTYFEPFLGGGAVFFTLAGEQAFDQAVVCDVNEDLVNSYRILQQGGAVLDELVETLKGYPHEREFYDEIRKKAPSELTPVQQAARFVYLNRTSFNGLYRVNRKGEFNAPWGQYTNPTICNEANLRQVSLALNETPVTVMLGDFEAAVSGAKEGDVVYFDPPYLPVSATSNFTEYSAGGFAVAEHERLARVFSDLASKGVGLLLSNSHCPRVFDLYEGFEIEVIQARRAINSHADKRGPVNEVLVSANLRVPPR